MGNVVKLSAGVLVLAALLPACSGSAPDSTGTSAGGTAGNSAAHASQAASVVVVDDMDHAGANYPALPPGSSGFYWRGGLGNWFVSSASALVDAQIATISPPRGDSAKAYRVTVTADEGVVDLWAQLKHPEGTAVDLNGYSGIGFWSRTTGAANTLTVSASLSGVLRNAASAHSQQVPLSSDWKYTELSFQDLGLDTPAAASIDFLVQSNGDPVDMWIDDMVLLCNGPC
jgi:hypothetical protein